MSLSVSAPERIATVIEKVFVKCNTLLTLPNSFCEIQM